MPRNVRNFWVELNVDGRKSRIACGPVRKDGGFDLTIRQRDRGDIVVAMDIIGRVDDDGRINLIASAGSPPCEVDKDAATLIVRTVR